MSSNCQKTVDYATVHNYSIMSMFACINEWIILQRTKITMAYLLAVTFKSLLRHLAPVKYISMYTRACKQFKKSVI